MNNLRNGTAWNVAGQPAARRVFQARLVLLVVLATSARADMYKADPSPGGIDPRPQITGFSKTSTNATLSWYGPTGPYRVQMTPTVSPSLWSDVASFTASTYASSLTLSNLPADHAFFRLKAPPNGYVGTGGCAGCHGDKYDKWYYTAHAMAYDSVASVPAAERQSCLPCHTVWQRPGGRLRGPGHHAPFARCRLRDLSRPQRCAQVRRA